MAASNVEEHPMPAPMPEHYSKAPTAAISKNIPLSEVNRHCTPEDCWLAINGKVYDVSEFMDRHPGGPTIVLGQAGKDATKMFNDCHKGVMIDRWLRPESYIGDLGIDEDLMSDEFWHTLRKARITEIQEELGKLVEESKEEAARTGGIPRKASNVNDLLRNQDLNQDVRDRVQSLETQKRAALDSEDFTKAQQIKAKVDLLLAELKVEIPSWSSAAAKGTDGSIPLSEVARHNKPHDAWVAICGVVYDLTDFIQYHPEQRNSILAWAGRDASAMWDKIPGRFPSTTWMSMYMRPEARMGEVGDEPWRDAKDESIRQLRKELRRLQGPSEEDIAAAKASKKGAGGAAAAPKATEESRFPKLAELAAGRGELPFFTRAEVAKHSGPTEPYMILHNKVYDLTPLLGAHPGGDEMLLTRAGTDATGEFELFDHSAKARVRRDQDMLVGEIVPAEHVDYSAEAAGGAPEGGVGGEATAAGSDVARYLQHKVYDLALALVGIYAYRSWKHSKPLPKLMYSRGLRHLHLIMAVGIFGAVGSAQAAAKTEGLTKKRWLQVHKQSGLAMLVALFFRVWFRMNSGIPPRFPGNPLVRAIETQSLRLFYAICLVLPVSGIAQEYYLKWAGGDDAQNDRLAQKAITLHKQVGRFFEYAWLPFHLGYTTLYHYSNGRGVVRKVSPFI